MGDVFSYPHSLLYIYNQKEVAIEPVRVLNTWVERNYRAL